MSVIGTLRAASNQRRMKTNGFCVIMTLVWGVTVMGQPAGGEKTTLPPLKDLGIVEAPKEVVLKGIEFDGNTVFTDEELLALVKDRIGKKAGVEELEAIRKTVSQHYFDAQYVNSGAVIDEQDLSKGVLAHPSTNPVRRSLHRNSRTVHQSNAAKPFCELPPAPPLPPFCRYDPSPKRVTPHR